jgi:hypothetical protein
VGTADGLNVVQPGHIRLARTTLSDRAYLYLCALMSKSSLRVEWPLQEQRQSVLAILPSIVGYELAGCCIMPVKSLS